MTPTQTMDSNTIEGIVDRIGLVGLMELVGELCGEKADHLRSNWQDEATARDWERCAKRIESCRVALAKLK